jgi:hypothetical protein
MESNVEQKSVGREMHAGELSQHPESGCGAEKGWQFEGLSPHFCRRTSSPQTTTSSRECPNPNVVSLLNHYDSNHQAAS